ncbi:MAG: YlmC/YmxH family sporulation protein [Bacilli bacterium]|jgi:YlmC/YmxH family sporulation protein
MRLSDLQNKDVICVSDGKKVGNIIDIRIDEQGVISSIIIEPSRKLFKLFSTREEIEIKWTNIAKIGEDVILVNITF